MGGIFHEEGIIMEAVRVVCGDKVGERQRFHFLSMGCSLLSHLRYSSVHLKFGSFPRRNHAFLSIFSPISFGWMGRIFCYAPFKVAKE
jgi:hypothetical protein